MLRIVSLVLILASVAACTTQRPREWTDKDWARLSQAVGEMEK